MGISFGSINTGLPPNIVQQLVEAERLPIKQLQARKAKTQEQAKLVDDLTSKVRAISTGLRELATTRGFVDYKLQSGDPNVISGSVDKNLAGSGTYQIEVEKLAHKTSALSNGFPDKDHTQVGVGYFKVYAPNGEEREVYVDNENNTLEKLAQLINTQSLGGLKASVIEDRSDKDNPWHLMLMGEGVGEDKEYQFPTFYFLDGDQDFYLDKTRPAENGKIKMDGFEFDIPDNVLKNVIPGVTLDLKQAAPGREISVSIAQDKEVIVGKVKKFIDGINAVLQFIQAQNNLNKDSDTTRTLGGDAVLRDVENRLRSALQDSVYGTTGSIHYLSQIGVTFNREGTLNFDDNKFNAAVGANLPDVEAFLVGDNQDTGFIPRLRRTIDNLLDPATGPLTLRSQGMRDKMERFDQQIANKERIVAQKEQQLKEKFSRLEETMSRLKSQGNFLAARMGNGNSNNNNGGGGGFQFSENSG